MSTLKDSLIDKLISTLLSDEPSNNNKKSIWDSHIGKKVIVRTYAAGVFYCTLKNVEEDTALMDDCRRIWKWEGAKELCDLSIHGIGNPANSRISVSTDNHLAFQVVEILECSKKCIQILDSIKSWSEHE